MGLIFDIHGWRGVSWGRDLLNWRLTFCFVTLMLCRLCITDKLAELNKRLDELEKILKGKLEGK